MSFALQTASAEEEDMMDYVGAGKSGKKVSCYFD